MELEAEDWHRLRAAAGWIELGLPAEAEAELSGLRESARAHPAALDLGWSCLAAQERWEEAYVVAEGMIRLHAGLLSGWINRAYSARRMKGGGLELALEKLLPAATLFGKEPMVAFNLACYLVRLGRLEEGWRWYREAESRGEAKTLRLQALADKDLEELWERIRGLDR